MIQSDNFNTEMKGSPKEILLDHIHIIGTIIVALRDLGASDETIEKQLVNCIAGGFEMAERIRKEREK